jgi:acyl-CoA thioester hydrolase
MDTGNNRMDILEKKFPVVMDMTVQWGEMDIFQHVNNVVYFRYFENVRVEYGRRMGIVELMADQGIGPILASIECKYIRPVTFPDTLSVGVRVSGLEGSEMRMEYRVVSAAHKAVAAVGRSLGVFYDYRNLKRVDFPAFMVARIEEIEGGPVPKHEAREL